MAKQWGGGDNFYLHGYDISGDVGSIERVGGGPNPWSVTGINKSATERLGLQRDGAFDFTTYFNPSNDQAHDRLENLPTTDVIVSYCRGTALGSPMASSVTKQLNYDPTRGADGSLTFTVQARPNGFGVEWGELLTAGKRTDTGATNGSGVDFTASTAFGLQMYLQVFAFSGTDVTIKVQESSDNAVGDPYADVVGATVPVTTAPAAFRVATSASQTVERWLRATTATTGGFSSVTFALVAIKNPTATAF